NEKTGISAAAFLCAVRDCRIALIYQLNDILRAFALIFPINPRRIYRENILIYDDTLAIHPVALK
ncbi:hypothetical protein, partial [Serratia sp. OLFL2]|uniref:hypothetical protein n=1 Tax=Serratia sp. OLFL2 TaxID=1914911 RepID=UPI001A7E17AF